MQACLRSTKTQVLMQPVIDEFYRSMRGGIMKVYAKPELVIEKLISNVPVATDIDPFSLLEGKSSGGAEVEISVPGGWWEG